MQKHLLSLLVFFICFDVSNLLYFCYTSDKHVQNDNAVYLCSKDKCTIILKRTSHKYMKGLAFPITALTLGMILVMEMSHVFGKWSITELLRTGSDDV